MAAEIKRAHADAEVKLIQSSGGVFEIAADDRVIFSKKKLGRHAEPGEVLKLLETLQR